MRELPEPDSYTWGASDPNVFTPGLVKAIQKQAYEDGLRDAAGMCEKERLEFVEQSARNNGRQSDMAFGSVNSAERIMKEIYDLLAASQKEAK